MVTHKDVEQAVLEIHAVSGEYLRTEIDLEGYLAVVDRNTDIIRQYQNQLFNSTRKRYAPKIEISGAHQESET